MSVVHDLATTVLSQAPSAPSGGGGVIDWGNGKVAELGSFFRGFSVVAGIGFVIFQALVSRGAFSRIIVSGLAAAVFIWIVWNVTNLKDRVGKDLQASHSVVWVHPGSGHSGTALTASHSTVAGALR